MTIEELNQYDALNESSKKLYKDIMTNHPGWNHKQLMCRITVDKKLDEHLIDYGDDKSETEFMGNIEQRQSLFGSIIDIFK